MSVLLAVTKKRRNLIRLNRAAQTLFKEMVHRRASEADYVEAGGRYQRVHDEIKRIFEKDCKAAKHD